MKKIIVVLICISIIGLSIMGYSDNWDISNFSFAEEDHIDQISKDLVGANNGFAFNIFKKLNHEDTSKNVFISPFSISTALSMIYNGAETSTKEAMSRGLGYSNIELKAINENYRNLITYLNNVDEKIQLNIANSIWIREGENIREDFISRNRDFFNAEVNMMNFSSNTAADRINGWISDKTEGKIDKMLDPPIPNQVVMYLINAIYFKGQWTDQFDPEHTFDTDFTTGNGEKKQVKMMDREDNIDYLDAEGYKAVRLPYGNKKTAMYCILPDVETDINEFVNRLHKEEWDKIRSEITPTEDVILQIPKFKVEYGEKELNNVLKLLGMEEAFSGNADFSGIREGLFISRVLHKAVIEVNEEGSEATAVTMLTGPTSCEEPVIFVADRPFLFMIAEEDTGSILFMGKLYNI